MKREKLLISAHVDGEVESPWKEKLEAHIATNPSWAQEESAQRRVKEALGKVPEVDVESSRQKVWSALQGRIAAEEVRIDTLSSTKKTPFRAARPMSLWVGAAVAALAIFALGAGYLWGTRGTVNENSDLAEIQVKIPQNYDFQLNGEGRLIQLSNFKGSKP